jgi:hypothetical protein
MEVAMTVLNPVRRRSGRSTTVALAAIGTVVGAALLNDIVQIITTTTGRVLFTFGGADGRLPLTHLPQILQADLREGATGYLTDVPVWLRLLCASPAVTHALTIAIAAVFFIQIVRRIAAAHPFAPQVLRNWPKVSLVLIAGGILQGVMDTVAGVVIFTLASSGTPPGEDLLGADYSGIGTDLPQWPFFMILLGIVAAAVSTAFRSGARLEEEVVGVV